MFCGEREGGRGTVGESRRGTVREGGRGRGRVGEIRDDSDGDEYGGEGETEMVDRNIRSYCVPLCSE